MKKIAKLSLVATLALAGATSASAAMMDDVSVSGKVYVEAIATTDKKADKTTTTTDLDFDAKITKKIDDNLSATVRVQSDRETNSNAKVSDEENKNAVSMDNIYFTYTNSGATVIAGQQDINTPNTDGEVGTGLLATYGVTKGVTLAAAHFVNNAIKADSDISAAAVLASMGPVNAQLWYVAVSAHSVNTTAVVGGKFGPVSAEARYAMTDWDESGKKDGTNIKVGVSANLGVASVRATYFSTDKDGAAFVTDKSSANTLELSQAGFLDSADVTAYHVGATVPVGPVSALVDYVGGEIATTDVSELRLRAKAGIAKNTTMMATYSIYEVDQKTGADTEKNSARLEVKYTF
jgi:hypothetical protein